jgi:phosphoglycerate dehydrogenase-like enzyme
MLKGLYILGKGSQDLIYSEDIREQIERYVEIFAPPMTSEEVQQHPEVLRECEVVFGGWGMVKFDKEILDMMPNLKAVFYGSGSIRSYVTDEFWARGIKITSAYGANAIPVAEYTLSQILFSLKDGYRQAAYLKEHKKSPQNHYVHGCFRSTVGIISLGMIGRLVCKHLSHFDMNVIAYDPFASDEVFHELGVTRVDTLEEIFERSDVVSLHTPWLPETEGMITGKLLYSMKQNGIFINTSRGAVVNEKEMIEVLQNRQDMFAILDVVWPEPAEPDSPLYTLPNVIMTPHIAGTLCGECSRMGQFMVDELYRYLDGKPLLYEIDERKMKLLA